MINVRCPICDGPMKSASMADWPEFPFCSERCKLIDLGRWLGEAYRVAPEVDGELTEPIPEEQEIP